MGTEPPQTLILDACVLINFLVVDRLDLLGAHALYRFLITDHVRGETADNCTDQLHRLEAALREGQIEETDVRDPDEVSMFVQLSREYGLGVGECSAIAAAVLRGIPLAIDDKQAQRRAKAVCPSIEIHTTESLMVSMIQAGQIDLPTADGLKVDWAANHRFRLMFDSFADRV